MITPYNLSASFVLLFLLLLSGCIKPKTYNVPKIAGQIQQMCIRAVDSNKLALAENYSKLALRYNPNFVEALNGLALVEIRRGHLRKAESLLKQALSIHSRFAPALNTLGSVYHRQRNYSKAEHLYRSAWNNDQTLTSAAYNLIHVLMTQNRTKDAENFTKQLPPQMRNRLRKIQRGYKIQRDRKNMKKQQKPPGEFSPVWGGYLCNVSS